MVKPDVHIYGTADSKDQSSSPPEGLRGERTATESSVPPRTHSIDADGRKIPVEETSGVAQAEAGLDIPIKPADGP